MKKLLIVFVLGLLIGSSVTHYYHKTKTIKEKGVLTERYERNQKLPNFTLDTLDGDVLSLDEFEDKKIVLNFFPSWCPHCKEETPHLIQLKKAHEDVVVLMMNLTLLEDQFEDIETFQKVYDVNLPILVILFALGIRMIGTWLSLIGTDLDSKEKTFTLIAYLPKATVQAAIGGVPLAMGLPAGELILTMSVLAILITAPLGAFGIDFSYRKLLTDDS